MADNFIANPGAGGSTFAADDIGGVLYPRSKVVFGVDGVATDVSTTDPLPTSLSAAQIAALAPLATQPVSGEVAPTGQPAAYWPSYSAPTETTVQQLAVDTGGALVTRGAVLTDEGTFRANFANTSLAVAIGSVTVSGNIVTGTGFDTADVHMKDYFKLDADAESAWLQIDSIDSATQITLVSPYVGGASGAASRALMRPTTGAGGSITVLNGQCVMTSGVTSGSRTIIARVVDYAPLVYRQRLQISQRVANQNLRIGFSESSPTPRWFARFRLTGTDAATLVTCESARNPTAAPSAAETESTQVVIPSGKTSAVMLDYRVELLTELVRFYIDGVLVAEHSRSLPSAYDIMVAGTLVENTGIPASSTTVTVDYVTTKNHNKLEIGVMSDAEKIVAVAAPLASYAYNVAGVIPINTDLLVFDCSQLRSLFIQCASMGTTGNVTAQWCNEPTFAQPITATLMSEAGATATTFNAAVLRVTNVLARYFRLRLTTATTAGTTTINAWGSQNPYTPIVTTQPVSVTNGSVVGSAAHSAASSGNPVRIGGRVNTAVDTTLVAGDASDVFVTTGGQALIKPYGLPETDWQFAGATGGIINTTDVVLRAAGAAGVRNYCTSISVQNASATIATEVVIKDGATVIWRGYVGTSAILNSAVSVTFPTPLRGTAATALNVACITTGAAVYVNAQGYQAI